MAYFFQRGDPGSWSAALHRTPEFMMRPCDKGRHEGLEARHGLATVFTPILALSSLHTYNH